MAQTYDFIIVGQGLVGSLVAMDLIKRGKSVMVMDHNHDQSSSAIAAGLINPISGPRLHLVSQFESYIYKAKKKYHELESFWNTSLLIPVTQHRKILSEFEKEYLDKRLLDSKYHPYIIKSEYKKTLFVPSPYESIEIRESYYLEVKKLLGLCKKYFIERGSYQNEKFDHQTLQHKTDCITYKNIQTQSVIFCEGHQVRFNPFFSHLPLNPSKGEIISVSMKSEKKFLHNWGHWMLPVKNNVWMLGANFTREKLDTQPTQEALNFLLGSAKENLTLPPFDMIAHEAGIRPSTKGHLPLIGPHSKYPKLYCCNGFGSKACLKAPYYSELLVDHILDGRTIPKEFQKCL
ncbi:MAG: FAD-dependent oxidoreductase [Bdellovibrionales bacterium]|nr:FAD-dependent oxidoreductase [Bdellovibrionales bacterium]